MKITNKSINILGFVNGNILTKSINYVTASIKLIYFTLVCPITEFILNISNQNTNNTVLTQSKDSCFLLKIITGKELKATIENF